MQLTEVDLTKYLYIYEDRKVELLVMRNSYFKKQH